ncbi:Os09g0425700 [Oryza sativa Japonica Group]|uniref:Os09g0425700 protein n=1 Tax=Oryza sativa subsp. japonica TaxID=39947 RepID=A0A0P0XNQ8_ORYSJ|nr:hypothetical protein EE612_047938 [Oryza sativa]BAT08169.1 Os09g0425700 [Oryza sativa Japonica Group]
MASAASCRNNVCRNNKKMIAFLRWALHPPFLLPRLAHRRPRQGVQEAGRLHLRCPREHPRTRRRRPHGSDQLPLRPQEAPIQARREERGRERRRKKRDDDVSS